MQPPLAMRDKLIETRCFNLSRAINGTSQESSLFLQLKFPWTYPPAGDVPLTDCPEFIHIRSVSDSASPLIELDDFDGIGLASVLERETPGPEWALAILRQIAAALDHLHASNRMHGALKPSSIMVGEGPSVRVVDWMVDWNRVEPENLSDAAEFLSPERLANNLVGPAADQFALGVLAHRLLTGRQPFSGSSLAEKLFCIRYGLLDQDLLGETGFAAHAVYDRVLSVNPDHRYDSCAAFIQELERIPRRRSYSETRLMEVEDQQAVSIFDDCDNAQNKAASPALTTRSFSPWWAAAAVLALVAFVLGILNWRLQGELQAMTAQAANIEDSGRVRTLENGAFQVCNVSPKPLDIRELAVAYWDASHKLNVFTSSAYTQTGWVIAPASSQRLSWSLGDSTVWDGSALFYFVRAQRGQKEFVISGRWNGDVQGCLHLS